MMEEQTPPVHKDLYISQFDELKSTFYKLKPVSVFKKDDALTFNGFGSMMITRLTESITIYFCTF